MYKNDIELDAFLLYAGVNYGRDAILEAGFLRRDKLNGPSDTLARCEWFKKQPKRYRDKVIARVIEMEKKNGI